MGAPPARAVSEKRHPIIEGLSFVVAVTFLLLIAPFVLAVELYEQARGRA